MARIRTVKPSMWADEKLARCSLPARLTFIGLLTESDDEGRQLYSGTRIAGALFPVDSFPPRKVMGWVGELEMEEIVHPYTVNSGNYLCIPNFKDHQVINRPAESTFPPCPIHGVLTKRSRINHGSITERSVEEVEVGSGKEKEWNGRSPDESGPENQTPPTDLSDWAKRLADKNPWSAKA